MSERRVTQVLEEWRRLERRLAAETREPAEQAHLRARLRELRAEYHRLTVAAVDDDTEPPRAPERPADPIQRV